MNNKLFMLALKKKKPKSYEILTSSAFLPDFWHLGSQEKKQKDKQEVREICWHNSQLLAKRRTP